MEILIYKFFYYVIEEGAIIAGKVPKEAIRPKNTFKEMNHDR